MTIALLLSPPSSLNALRLILQSILSQHQFAYWANRPTEDAVMMTLHTALTHLDQSNTQFHCGMDAGLPQQQNSAHQESICPPLLSRTPVHHVSSGPSSFPSSYTIPPHPTNTTVKFANKTTILGVIKKWVSLKGGGPAPHWLVFLHPVLLLHNVVHQLHCRRQEGLARR